MTEQRNTWGFKLVGKYKSIENIEWQNIPDFAVLTGPNGSGKSQLLNAIINASRNEVSINRLKPRIRSRRQDIINIELKIKDASLDKPERINLKNCLVKEKEILSQDELQLSNLVGFEYLTIEEISQIFPEHIAIVDNAFKYSNYNRFLNVSTLNAEIKKLYNSDKDIMNNPGRAIDLSNPIEGLPIIIHRYRMLDFLRYEAIRDGDVTDDLPEPPWSILNKLFEHANFDVRITVPKTSPDNVSPLIFVSKGAHINVQDLSSGELTMVGLVVSIYSCSHGANLPSILLLDEIDAHLHPSLSAYVLNSIRKVFVQERNIKVIMTTHSPSTVALAPDDAIFSISNNEITKMNKWDAINTLTSGIVSVGPHTRFVFVEDQDDVKFYTKLIQVIEGIDNTFPKNRFVFIAASKGRNGGGCNEVISWIKTMNSPSIIGLIDKDDNNVDYNDRVFKIERYSIENYCVDPIMYALFLGKKDRHDALDNFDMRGLEATIIDATGDKLQPVIDQIIMKLKNTDRFRSCDNEKLDISYLNGPTVQLPKWFMDHRGKDIQKELKNIFTIYMSIDHYIQLIDIAKLIPEDLVQTLRRISQV